MGAADTSPPPTENFADGVRHLVPHCASVGWVAGVGLPKGLATAFAVPCPRRPHLGKQDRATPPHSPQARMGTRVPVCTRPASDLPTRQPPPTKSNLARAGQAWGVGGPGRERQGRDAELPCGGDDRPFSRGALSPWDSLRQTLFGAASAEGVARARWEGARGGRPYLRRRPLHIR